MCRIAGIIDLNKPVAELQQEAKAMCSLMAHGGPDGEGYYFDEEKGLVFGHRRLALIDLSPAGQQPMSIHNGHLTITYNGEIYNFQELKKELVEAGFDFVSHSDTEVILAAYQRWGVASFSRLNGMFAFALYDQLEAKTFLVRDPSGIKPLYYYNENGKLIFSSEVKAFSETDLQLSELPEWKVYFLAFGHLPEPYTTLAQVKMLPKGSYLSWDHQLQQASITAYYRSNLKEYCKDQQRAETALSEIFKEAIARHLISDAPIGVFLSGGIDSSLLTLLSAQSLGNGQHLKTISINFSEQQFSEQVYQDRIAKQTQSEHAAYLIDKDSFEKHLPTALAAMDQPTTDGINSWFVNYFAKEKGLKAVLSGIGGDELFGGYPAFKRMKMVRLLSKLPRFILKKGIHFKQTYLKRAYYLSYKNTAGKYLFLRGIYAPTEIASILNIKIEQVDEILQSMLMPVIPLNLTAEQEAGWLEFNLYMQNQLLKDTDAMSMQHGIEVRVPFLDKDLIQLLDYTSAAIRYQQAKPKGFLIDTFKNILPEAIWNREKMGFTFPFQTWLQTNNFFLKALTTVNPKVTELKAAFVQGELHWSKAIALYQLARWENGRLKNRTDLDRVIPTDINNA